jgi:hypothetical protein
VRGTGVFSGFQLKREQDSEKEEERNNGQGQDSTFSRKKEESDKEPYKEESQK